MKTRKKLIEVALPLEAINIASAREKSIRLGHPSTLHLWWARRPLAAARAIIFAQTVDDPSEYVEELLADPLLRSKAEKAYRLRLKSWEDRSAIYHKARAAGIGSASNVEPGKLPTLEGTVADMERQRLFEILEALVLWENTTNEAVIRPAREEIWRSWRRTCNDNNDHPRAKELFDPQKLPDFHDPFAGGGALPLEAQRLGLDSYASDLNPVAVMINKAMIEVPPKFSGKPPVNPDARKAKDYWSKDWKGAQGLADDVHYYGQWMRDEAEKRVGHLYSKIEITSNMAKERPDLKEYVGRKLTVIAWIWARTVKSPNPAFAQVDVPLASTFMISTKVGNEAYVEPIIQNNGYRFNVRVGKPKNLEATKLGTSAGKRAAFKCLMSGTPLPYEYIRSEGHAGRMSARLMAIVADGDHGRIYLSPADEIERLALDAKPDWKPDCEMPKKHRNFQPPVYGINNMGDLFTSRQLITLTTLCDLVKEARAHIISDSLEVNNRSDTFWSNDNLARDLYAKAIGIYLAFAVSRLTMRCSSQASWDNAYQKIQNVFGRQALPMVWDYCEGNPFGSSSGNFQSAFEAIVEVFSTLVGSSALGEAVQADAATQSISVGKVISTDPPYYDNIDYADLSDFFYVWLRRSLQFEFPELFATMSVPKADELIATPHRHGSKEKAETFFLTGMTKAMQRLADQAHVAFPVTIYYAFKQSETEGKDGTSSTGWETFLGAVIQANFAITGTWPIRTEMKGRVLERGGSNALASSIVLVCRKREANAPTATRREFITALQTELPSALANLQAGNIAPVDLAQAAIGPGMAIYTRYDKVLDAQGKVLSIRQALALINETLDEALTEQEGDFDADTRWALAWFEQSGFAEGEFGVADVLARAKDTSVDGMVEAGILASGKGKVRLLKPAELPENWDPNTDKRLTAWEMVHQLIRVLEGGGESSAALLMSKLGAKAETARELCYRLYNLCERKKRATEALSYNALVQSWSETQRLARESRLPTETQTSLF